MACPNFSEADFAKWNETASCFRIPKKLIGSDNIRQVRLALIAAIGAERLRAVQGLPDHVYRVEFVSRSVKLAYDLNGLDFRGVSIIPTPAYEHLVSVFVDRAPLQMPDHYFSASLAAYGRVVSVKSLTVRGHAHIRTGTRMVRMSISAPIPQELTIATFRCSVRYRGQPRYCFGCRQFGHMQHLCPTSGRQRKAAKTSQSASPRTFAAVVAPVNDGASTSSAPMEQYPPEAPVDAPLEAPVDVPPEMDVSEPVAVVPRPDAPLSGAAESSIVVEISEFSELRAADENFACQRRVTIVQNRTSSKGKAKRLQGARSLKGSRASSSPLADAPLALPEATPSPQPASSLWSTDSGSPSSGSGKVRMSRSFKKQLRQSSRQLYLVQASSRKRVALESSVGPTVEVSTQAVTTTNRFSCLMDEAEDIVALGESVIDPLASPSVVPKALPSASPFSSACTPDRGALVPTVSGSDQVLDVVAPAQFSPSVAEFSQPPNPERLPLCPATNLSEGTSSPSSAIEYELYEQCLASLFDSSELAASESVARGTSPGAITTPSFNVSSSGESTFYHRSFEPAFQEGGSDHDFSFSSEASDASPSSPVASQSGILPGHSATSSPTSSAPHGDQGDIAEC